ncbi:exosortase F system-associated membrane protein [Flavobacterium taihuense]|uniref:Exosortase F system-associated protein n=1 Tax=Flavobacterium taihuense TaxID=2857508 RepID=A0ABS6XSW5_9FLAO|nr:exosortase F system-associated protein [Flavobacterium taihuense]MBW4359750.1 exosortase F system-associated protein [Flavobacterium taihuense]
MLNKILRNKRSYSIISVLISLLVGIRAFEGHLFYDPFLVYFEGDYLKMPLPDFNASKLFLGLSLRFFLNTILSLGVLYTIFKDKEMIQFAALLYFFFFLILIIGFFLIPHFYANQNNLLLFYVRRFLIQPLFLIILIPAFYYQKLNK